MGGLGNQIFMIFCAVAYAKKHGLEYIIPDSIINPHYAGQKAYPFKGIKYSNEKPHGLINTYTEPFFHYKEIPEFECDHLHLSGYFQSHLYSEGFENEIIELLCFPWNIDMGWCSIHVRRSDYLKYPDYHPFVGEEYLSKAMAEMKYKTGITKFRVFSDDLPWCVDFFEQFKQYEFDYWIGGSEIDDLQKGSCCQNQILSNSTFSLAMHRLNRNDGKICIAPSRWFGVKAGHDTKDLYPKTAFII